MADAPDSGDYPSLDLPPIGWVLECGCEPEIEHCPQCDDRRRRREQMLAASDLHERMGSFFEGKNPSYMEADALNLVRGELRRIFFEAKNGRSTAGPA